MCCPGHIGTLALWGLLVLTSPGLSRLESKELAVCCEHRLGSGFPPLLEPMISILFLALRKSLSSLAFSPDGKYIVTGEVSCDHD